MDKIKILIAEDSKTQAMQLQYMLEDQGYEVLVASDGVECLEMIYRFRPSIVISDIVMPRMDGYELCAKIRGDASLNATAIILLTTLSEPEDVIRSLQCGADKFFTKPYDQALLLSTIERLLDNSSQDAGEGSAGMGISYGGQHYTINSDRRQILTLLISTYEAAVRKSSELQRTQEDLNLLNKNLEEKVTARTADLQAKNEELNLISQQLWQATKLATMGELAASIAHELNNPLAIISLRIESLMAATTEGSPQRHSLEVISQEVDRMGKLVNNLLAFCRKSHREIAMGAIDEEIERALELTHYHLRKHDISVERAYDPDVPQINMDCQQMRQIFLNLFTNACDAMPDGGSLKISLSPSSTSRDIIVEITDTGKGIQPEFLQKVTDPFFTTKPEGHGTGLGLSICKRIIKEHKGTLDIISSGTPGKGTTVRLMLPVS